MAKTEKVICDYCESDLTYTTNCVGYRLELSVESKPLAPNIVPTLGFQYPPFNKTIHFCGVGCLKKYINEKWKD